MNTSELRELLDGELAGFPERASGEEGYRFLVRVTRPYVGCAREALVEVLQAWVQLRAEPKSMLAVKLAVEFRLGELRNDVEELLNEVREGVAFNPALGSYYENRLTDALSRI